MTTYISGDTGVSKVQDGADMPAGAVLQVINAYVSAQASSGAAAWSATGLTATITPRKTTSKILVIVSQNGVQKNNGDAANSVGVRLMRDSTEIARLATQAAYTGTAITNTVSVSGSISDSPNTTSPVTYSTQFNNPANFGTVYVQSGGGVASTITLMEIEG